MLLPARDGKQVRRHAQKLGDALEGARGVEDGGALDRVIPSRGEIWQQESRAVHADQVRDGQARVTKFGAELMRPHIAELARIAEGAISSTCPLGSPLATAAAPTFPPAPGRFSTTTDTWRDRESSGAMARGRRSEVLPGA